MATMPKVHIIRKKRPRRRFTTKPQRMGYKSGVRVHRAGWTTKPKVQRKRRRR